MLLNIASFIFVLGILIFIHELGHFLLAKRVGIRVDQFSLGFPPHLFKRKWGGTEYCIGVIPLGGYVKMAGENPGEERSGSPDEFMSKTVGQRAAVIFAGPFMNYLLAIALLIGIAWLAGRPVFDTTRVLVGKVEKDTPAAKAGLQTGDQIIAINGEAVANFDSAAAKITPHIDAPITVTWIHAGDTVRREMVTEAQPRPNARGGIDTVGVIGFTQKAVGTERVGLLTGMRHGFVEAHQLVWFTVKFVKQLITAEVSVKMVGGPVFIARESGRQAQQGAANLFYFMALLSVNLAVLNILPIPVLDGGHLLFLAIERLKGSPLSMRARVIAQQVGIVAILALVLLVTYNDILRVIRGM